MGNMSGSYGSHYTLRIDSYVIYKGSSTENYSTVRADLWLDFDGSSYYAYTSNTTSGWININGSQGDYSVDSIRFSSGTASSVYLGTRDVTVWHNDDGTCPAIGVSAYWNTNTSRMGAGSTSTTVYPSRIDIYSNATSITIGWAEIDKLGFHITTDRSAKIYLKLDSPVSTNWLNNGGVFSQNTTDHWFDVNYQNRENTDRLKPNTSYSFTVLVRSPEGLDKTWSGQIGRTANIATITEAPSVNIGESHTIKWNNPTGAQTSLKLCELDGTLVENFGTVTGNSYNALTSSDTLYYLTPNSNTLKLKYVLTTTKNSISYNNEKECSFLVTNSNPTFSDFSFYESDSVVSGLTGGAPKAILKYSDIKSSITLSNSATARNSATMSSYVMSIGDASTSTNYSSTETVNLELLNVESDEIVVYAVDSRGNSTPVSKKITQVKYKEISILSFYAERTDSVRAETTLNFTIDFWNNNFGVKNNSIKSIYYEYKKTQDVSFTRGQTALTYSVSGNTLTGSCIVKGDLGADGFDESESFDLRLYVKDELSEDIEMFTLGPGSPAFAVKGNCIALGGKYDEDVGGRVQINGDSLEGTPIGTIQAFSGDETPNTWLLCDGSEVSRTTYSELFDVIGTKYGTGDGSTTFNLPNLKGKIPVGLDSEDTDFSSLGKTGGEKTQELRALIGATDSDASRIGYRTEGVVPTKHYTNYGYSIKGESFTNRTSINHSTTVLRSDGEYPNNLQPYVVVNYIIKATSSIGVIKKTSANVIDNLQSTSTTDALSANQGKILNDKINNSAIGITLYDNSSGTTGTVTLSESAANFTYLEIFTLSTSDGIIGYSQNSTKVCNPNGKSAWLTTGYCNNTGSDTYNIKLCAARISGEYIDRPYGGWEFKDGSHSSTNYVGITKVIGYK